jgi:hypothetical protein
MRNDEVGRLRWVRGVGFGWSFDGDPVATEDEKIQIELAWPPPLTLAPPERPLEALEGDEQGKRASDRVGAAGNVERDDGVAELRLIGDPDGLRGKESRDASQSDLRQGGQ